MAKAKLFKINSSKSGSFSGNTRYYEGTVGTLEDQIDYYDYTLEAGVSWQNEKGNKKINRNPKSIKSLVTNLYNAKNNTAVNGYSGTSYESVPVTAEEKAKYWDEKEREVA